MNVVSHQLLGHVQPICRFDAVHFTTNVEWAISNIDLPRSFGVRLVPRDEGIEIWIVPGSFAEVSDLHCRDILTMVNTQKVATLSDAIFELHKAAAEGTFVLTVKRDGTLIKVRVPSQPRTASI